MAELGGEERGGRGEEDGRREGRGEGGGEGGNNCKVAQLLQKVSWSLTK